MSIEYHATGMQLQVPPLARGVPIDIWQRRQKIVDEGLYAQYKQDHASWLASNPPKGQNFNWQSYKAGTLAVRRRK